MREDHNLDDMMNQLQQQMNSYDHGGESDQKKADADQRRSEYTRDQENTHFQEHQSYYDRNSSNDDSESEQRRQSYHENQNRNFENHREHQKDRRAYSPKSQNIRHDANYGYGRGNTGHRKKKSSKKPIFISLVVAVVIIIAGVIGITRFSSGEGIFPGPRKEWSVFIYFCGSNLESEGGCASSQIDDILSADLQDVNVIIETGGAKEWENSQVDSSVHQRFEVVDHELKEVDQEEKRSMGDPETLADFLKWGAKRYPAKKYAAVLWDHGGGSLNGVCFDEQFEKNENMDGLSLPELGEAFQKSGVKFETVFLDACLMASLETAETMEPYANYMVASEDSEPGAPSSYRTWLENLSEDPDMSGRQLGKDIVNAYYESSIDQSEGSRGLDLRTALLGTMSVIDLDKIPDILAAFSKINDVMKESVNDPDTFGQIVRGANQARSFSDIAAGMVDMYDLVEKISPAVQKASPDDIYRAIKAAVVTQKTGRLCDDVHGLSVFYPKKDNTTDPEMTKRQIEVYSQISQNQPYIDFMYGTDYANWTDDYHGNDDIDDSNGAPQWTYEENLNDEGQLELTVTNPDNLEGVYDQLTTETENEDGDPVTVNLGQMINKNIAVDTSENTETFQSQFDGTWTEIDGVLVSLAVIEVNDEEHYTRGLVPALVNGEQGGIDVVYLQDTEEYRILGWHKLTEDGIGERTETIPDGAELQFIYEGTQSGDNISAVSSETVTYSDSTQMDHDYDLEARDYTYQFFMRDIYGNEVETPGATYTVGSDGELSVRQNQ